MNTKFTYPGIFTRLMSFSYDLLLVMAVWFLFGFIFLGLFKTFAEGDFFPPEFGILIIGLSTAGYYGFFWSNGRNTLGMSTWKHRLVADNGTKISFSLALKRLGLSIILNVISFIYILIDKENRCLVDKILGLRVVKKTPSS